MRKELERKLKSKFALNLDDFVETHYAVVCSEVLTNGRCGVLVDIDDQGNLHTELYSATSILENM